MKIKNTYEKGSRLHVEKTFNDCVDSGTFKTIFEQANVTNMVYRKREKQNAQ